MDLLRKELERKRKTIDLAKKSNVSCNSTAQGKRTYLKSAELRKFQEKREEEERKNNRDNRIAIARYDESQDRKRRRRDEGEDEDADGGDTIAEGSRSEEIVSKTTQVANESSGVRSTGMNANDNAQPTNDNTSGHKNKALKMPSSELTNALRELGIPVWLFGEKDDMQRMGRLQEARDSKKALMAGMSEIDDFKLGSGHNVRNPFLGGKKEGGNNDDLGFKKKTTGSTDKQKEETEQDEDDESDPHKTIHRFFKSQLRQWEDDLVNRTESVKRSLAGKNETKTLKQCKDYIRPLFKQCKNRRLEESLMAHLLNIVKFCKEGEFVKANDSYIDVAIGRAAWPIGVTMVGIHARSGRAKIESSNVAHVMNSEMQRKYLTSVKRLITYCQKKRDDVAPSKKVTNV